MPKLRNIPPALRQQCKEASIQQILNHQKSQAEVAREFGVSRQAVSLWVKNYKNAGNTMPQRKPYARNRESYENRAKIAKRHNIPQYEQLANDLGLDDNSRNDFDTRDETTASAPEILSKNDKKWENLSASEYYAKLKDMQDEGIQWECLRLPAPTHSNRTGKHRKQSNPTRSTKAKRRAKSRGNNKKKRK